jgi:hypothetical protein
MKNSINLNTSQDFKSRLAAQLLSIKKFYAILLLFAALVFTACEQETMDPQFTSSQKMTATSSQKLTALSNELIASEANVINLYPSIPSVTAWELQQARAATARYRDIRNALKDEYVDISVIKENMGYHYMKVSEVDAIFDWRKPEILVYNKNHEGNFELVAVEYAIPLTLSTNAPEGFSGTDDVWDENHVFGLWLLHAWVWSYNPDGVFNPTNPLVHLH